MLPKARDLLAPSYLLACLILGGSAQGIWQNMVLQLAGIAIIAWAAATLRHEPLALPAKQLLLLAIAAIAVVALQMIPLPLSVWSQLGPRQNIAAGFRSLGLHIPFEPLSLNAAGGLDSLLSVVPPLAIVCAMLRLKAYRPQWLAVALIAGTLAGVALGALQVASSSGELMAWYPYKESNFGNAVGFFANANHMATLLVIAIPFLAATIASAKSRSKQRYFAIVAVATGLMLVVVVGLVLNGSLAGYGFILPVMAASALIFIPPTSRWRSWVLGIAALLLVGSVIVLEVTPIGSGRIGSQATGSVQSRVEIFATTSRAVVDFMPFGSGLGSFRRVYQLYEALDQVTSTFVVHAHNDYAEVALELGLAGIALILVFFAWWIAAVARVWRTAEAGPFARAATIASAAVLVHSLVDYPLRTSAIAACFGMCLALLADSRSAPPKEKAELRRARHVEFR
jgi:O-antigen ligase